MSSTSLAVVVLCAGKGTRMKSEKAKVLHPLLGKPMCFYPFARALELNASRLVAVVGHQGQDVESTLKGLFPSAPLAFALQAEQKGTGHAVRCAEEALEGFEGPVLILYGDVPLLTTHMLQSLLSAYHSSSAGLSMVTTFPKNPLGYGRVVRDGGKVTKVVEQKDATEAQKAITECNAGIYVAHSTFLFEALRGLKASNAQQEYYLTDIVEKAALRGTIETVVADFEETAGVNDLAELAERAQVLRARINMHHMKNGVTLVHPESTFIDEGVAIGVNTFIGPMVSISSECVIGNNVKIGQGSVLSKTQVADGTEIKPYSVFEEAVVGKACVIGPFSRLRPGTELAEGVHLGNFVETKKARIGRGSKANHLAYLGDADIGSAVNVGAGTITCNYDGVKKHVTVLEDGVFIGSDSQLVAPVTVGQGAYVGAGSTITKNVPAGSLAVSRTPQVVKEGWAARKKKSS